MAIEVTEEMRRAVYAADCDRLGHQLNFRTLMTTGSRGALMQIGAFDPDASPYVKCERCGQVWILIEQPGETYEAAEEAVLGMLRPTADLAKRITERRKARQDRASKGAAGPA